MRRGKTRKYHERNFIPSRDYVFFIKIETQSSILPLQRKKALQSLDKGHN